MSEDASGSDLTDVESALRALVPASSRLDRDRLMFDAGASASARAPRRRWPWPSAAAALALVVAGESLLLALRPAPRVIERLVVIREPVPGVPSGPAATPVLWEPGGMPRDRFDDAWGDPTRPIVPSRWETVAEAHRLQDFALRFGLDGPAEPSGRRSVTGGVADGPERRPASVGELRRLDPEKLLNPGDRS